MSGKFGKEAKSTMAFLSYNLNYFTTEIARLESSIADRQSVYHAKQLLKMLDDLSEEGYTKLNDLLETSCQGVSKLKEYLSVHCAHSFTKSRKTLTEADVGYDSAETELTNAIQQLIASAKESKGTGNDAFSPKLVHFCEWLGYRENTAYIFLLRDTLLPYIYYRSQNRENIYPWLLGRKTLASLTGKANADDELRACIYKALELGKSNDFEEFCNSVLPDMRAVIGQYPEAEKSIVDLLNTVNADRIVVIESGCSGTFPMLLKSLDERVDVRIYTTYPYLLKAYGNRIYSSEYEDNRLFETLYSQDLYLRFAALKHNHFYVEICNDNKVKNNSYAEIKAFLRLSAVDLENGDAKT